MWKPHKMLVQGLSIATFRETSRPTAPQQRGAQPVLMWPTVVVPVCAGGAVKRQAELFFPAEFADDFPVSLQVEMEGMGGRVFQGARVCCMGQGLLYEAGFLSGPRSA